MAKVSPKFTSTGDRYISKSCIHYITHNKCEILMNVECLLPLQANYYTDRV